MPTDREITVYPPSVGIRARPAMYLGDVTDPATLGCLVVQGMCHGLDELVTGVATRFTVTLCDGGVVSLADDGAGMSVEPGPSGGPCFAEKLMTELRACKLARVSTKVAEKYCRNGLPVLNALSAWAELDISRDGRRHVQRYERGIPGAPFACLGPTDAHGTTLRFRPDPAFFAQDIDAAMLEARLAEIRLDVPDGLVFVDARTPPAPGGA
jgi:DNA gyrase subunit B